MSSILSNKVNASAEDYIRIGVKYFGVKRQFLKCCACLIAGFTVVF